MTVTLNSQTPTLSKSSMAVYEIGQVPPEKSWTVAAGTLSISGSWPELSDAVGAVHETLAELVPGAAATVILSGHGVQTGPSTSTVEMRDTWTF